jgi:hypothetical protein
MKTSSVLLLELPRFRGQVGALVRRPQPVTDVRTPSLTNSQAQSAIDVDSTARLQVNALESDGMEIAFVKVAKDLLLGE